MKARTYHHRAADYSFDQDGGRRIRGGWYCGRKLTSKLAAFGDVSPEHLEEFACGPEEVLACSL